MGCQLELTSKHNKTKIAYFEPTLKNPPCLLKKKASQQATKKPPKHNKGLCHIVALPFTLKKSILRQKKKFLETPIFQHAKKYNPQKRKNQSST
jgi:hypothetical protein